MLYQICTKQNGWELGTTPTEGRVVQDVSIVTNDLNFATELSKAEKPQSRLAENNYTAKIKNRLKKIQK